MKAAVARLGAKVEYTSLAAFLMSNEFTLTELRQTYEAIQVRELFFPTAWLRTPTSAVGL